MTVALREAAGSLLVVGLEGPELTGLERAWLRLVQPGGVILFKRNIVDAKQTHALLDEATGLSARHSVRCVDVEGGTVNRLRDALAPMPSVQAVAAAATKSRKPALAREHGELIARAVKTFGFNTTLAPVVDLGLPESASVMGSRTAGIRAADVVNYARPFLAGLAAQGIAGCGKHFPGLGGGIVDSHFETPEIRRSWAKLWNEDLVPYRELHTALPLVMVNHAAYPETAGKENPASASAFWINIVLRKKIGYRGLIVSDDLEMGGILKFLPVDQAAIAAVRAGTDLMLICHSPELILRTYESLLAEGERSRAFRTMLLARARDAARKRARLYPRGVGPVPNSKQLESLRKRIPQFSETVTASIGSGDAIDPRVAAPAETS
jgi:beta-N-acetylhexosaminidase